MAFLGDLCDSELLEYGITFCEDHEDGDRLIIAPGLCNHSHDLEDVEVHDSPVETIDYLFVGDELVGVGYLLFAGLINYFLNNNVPDEISMEDVASLTLLGMDDPLTRSRMKEAQYKRIIEVCGGAHKLIADMPPIPAGILTRIREHLEETYDTHTVH